MTDGTHAGIVAEQGLRPTTLVCFFPIFGVGNSTGIDGSSVEVWGDYRGLFSTHIKQVNDLQEFERQASDSTSSEYSVS